MQWISVKDAVPPDNRIVLILYKITDHHYPPDISIGCRVVYKNGKIKWKYLNPCGTGILCEEGKKCFHTLLCWQPLPKPPEGE